MLTVRHEFSFDASHQLPGETLHGHRYRLIVAVTGEPDESGMVISFEELEGVVRDRVLDRIHLHHLNEIVDRPMVEGLVLWIWEQLDDRLPGLSEVTLYETEKGSITYRGDR